MVDPLTQRERRCLVDLLGSGGVLRWRFGWWISDSNRRHSIGTVAGLVERRLLHDVGGEVRLARRWVVVFEPGD